jgi:hypothetical protein
MSDWADLLADTLGVARLSDREKGRLLGASRQVAHRVERKDTPLATFLVGVATGERVAAGEERDAAFAACVEALVGALPAESESTIPPSSKIPPSG